MQLRLSRARAFSLALIVAPFLSGSAAAQIAVSANDNKAVLVDGANTVPANPAPDTVTIIDLNVSPPKVIGEINVPTSVVGPPSSVAVAPDESFAIVTAASKLDPADPKKAICACDIKREGEWITAGGGCDTATCKTAYWSGATVADFEDGTKFMMKPLKLTKFPAEWCSPADAR